MSARHYRAADGVALAYDDVGPGNGPVLVFYHGLAATAEQFAADATYFADLGYRVLVPDLRGHGRSGAPVPLVPAGLSVERLAGDLVGMLDHAGAAKVHWIGNSLGGIVALEMLAAERFHSLATFGTLYAIKLPRIGGHRLIAAGHRLLGRDVAAALTARNTSRDPEARKLIERMLREVRPEVTAMLAGVLTRYDITARAAAAKLPILLLRGGEDRLVNAGLGATLWAMRGKPNFTLVDLAAGGHCANLDARDAFRAALLQFWSGVTS